MTAICDQLSFSSPDEEMATDFEKNIAEKRPIKILPARIRMLDMLRGKLICDSNTFDQLPNPINEISAMNTCATHLRVSIGLVKKLNSTFARYGSSLAKGMKKMRMTKNMESSNRYGNQIFKTSLNFLAGLSCDGNINQIRKGLRSSSGAKYSVMLN
jgi:hypothetical protein